MCCTWFRALSTVGSMQYVIYSTWLCFHGYFHSSTVDNHYPYLYELFLCLIIHVIVVNVNNLSCSIPLLDVRALHAFAFNICYLLDAEYLSSSDHTRVSSILSRLNQCQPPILLPELKHLLYTLYRIRQYLLKLDHSSSNDTIDSMCKHMYI